MRHRISDPFGQQDRQLHPNFYNTSTTTAPAEQQPSRTLKVEHLDGTTHNPSGKALLRLKGKWLAQIFAPNTRVRLHVERGRIVIERAS